MSTLYHTIDIPLPPQYEISLLSRIFLLKGLCDCDHEAVSSSTLVYTEIAGVDIPQEIEAYPCGEKRFLERVVFSVS